MVVKTVQYALLSMAATHAIVDLGTLVNFVMSMLMNVYQDLVPMEPVLMV